VGVVGGSDEAGDEARSELVLRIGAGVDGEQSRLVTG